MQKRILVVSDNLFDQVNNKYTTREIIMKYYVYVYKDPDTMQPFYIGKGHGNRYLDHANKPYHSFKRVQDKIKSIRNKAAEPIIEFAHINLQEEIAYNLEEELIIKYGRKDIDPDGILMNICLGARPPVYKNKNIIQDYYNLDEDITLSNTLITSVSVFLNEIVSRKKFNALLKTTIGKEFIIATKHFPIEYSIPQRLYHIAYGLVSEPTCKTCSSKVSFKCYLGENNKKEAYEYAEYCSSFCARQNPEYIQLRNAMLTKHALIDAANRQGTTYSKERCQAISNSKKGMKAPHIWSQQSRDKLSATQKRKKQ